MLKSDLTRQLLPLLVLLLLGTVIYMNTFHAPFLYDDENSIVTNQSIQDLNSFFGGPSGFDFNSNRVVGYLSFAINFYFSGLKVFSYHLINLLIHLGNALLVYALPLLLFRTPCLKDVSLAKRARWVALLAAALFVAHPLQTQAVTYIVQRLASLSTFFFLSTCVLYARARLTASPERLMCVKGVPLYLLSLITAALAMKTKEIAFTLPVILVLFEFLFFLGPPRRRFLLLLPHLLTMVIIPMSLLSLNQPIGQVLSDVNQVTRMANIAPELTRGTYLITQFSVICTYLRLLFWPTGQNLDYDYPIYPEFLSTVPISCFFLLLGLFLLGVALAAQRLPGRWPEQKLVGFGILWFFITISVESSLVPLADVIYEHRVYLPSFGVFLALATVFVWLVERLHNPAFVRAAAGCAVIVILLLGGATWARNQVWQSAVTLWSDVADKSPHKVRPFNNLGSALNDAGRSDEAIPILERAINIDPRHTDAYYNLGRAYMFTGRVPKAEQMYLQTIRMAPDYDAAYVNLAGAFNRMQQFQRTVDMLTAAIPRFKRPWGEAHFNLGVAYAYLGNFNAARRELEEVRRLEPGLAPSLANLIP